MSNNTAQIYLKIRLRNTKGKYLTHLFLFTWKVLILLLTFLMLSSWVNFSVYHGYMTK